MEPEGSTGGWSTRLGRWMEHKARLVDGAQGSTGGWQDEPAVVGGERAYLFIVRAGFHFRLLLSHFLNLEASARAVTAIFKKSRSVQKT
jgi:hypothetical protein